MNVYEVIMAGGGGTRFWPLSRRKKPKQFINVSGKDILLNETILRMDGVIDRENVYVVTNEEHRQLVQEQIVSGIPFRNILTEPVGRNTAPCILYAASVLMKEKGDGVMCVFASDHHIADEAEYQRIIRRAVAEAENSEAIMTIGIKPTFAATGYGYIRSGEQVSDEVYEVRQFVEKPDLETARKYVEAGTYSWNSGVFVFKVSTILNAYQKWLPQMYEQMNRVMMAYGTPDQEKVLREIYPQMQSTSIDYGIMEVAGQVRTIQGDYGWNDVGSLDELKTFYPADEQQNICIGETVMIDSTGCIAKSDQKLLALVGLRDVIAVETEDAILICQKDRAQDVKKVVEELKRLGKDQYL